MPKDIYKKTQANISVNRAGCPVRRSARLRNQRANTDVESKHMTSWLDASAQTITDRSTKFDETEIQNFTLPSPLRPSHPSDDAKHAPAQLDTQRQTCHDTSNIQDLHHSTGHVKQVFTHQPR